MEACREADHESESGSSDEAQVAGAAALRQEDEQVNVLDILRLLDDDVGETPATGQQLPQPCLQPVVQEADHVPDELRADRFNEDLVVYNIISLAYVQLYEEQQRQQRLIRGLLCGEEASAASSWRGGQTPMSLRPAAQNTRPPAPNLTLCPTATSLSSSCQCSLGDSHIMARHATSQILIRCTFGSLGSVLGTLNSPHGFCLGNSEEVLVADTNNHRIQIFTVTGRLLSYFGAAGREDGFLWYPRKVAVLSRGQIVVCDRGPSRSRMQIFSPIGHLLRAIRLPWVDIVAGIAVTRDDHIAVVDSVKPTVYIFSSDSGELLQVFDCLGMLEPSDIAYWRNNFYICDFKGHRVAIYSIEGVFLRNVGDFNTTPYPNGIDISDHGDIIVGDSHGNQVHMAVFANDGTVLEQFYCPQIKVSRCCGLKITSDGSVVTVAKNNHSVLVIETLYV